MTLSQKWSEGLRTLHGLQTNGFPNCFFLGYTQTAITVSMPHALNEQAKHVTHILQKLGVETRTGATARARALGLLPQDGGGTAWTQRSRP